MSDLNELLDAVGKLVKAKGRFHTEQNYKALEAAYDRVRATQPASAPAEFHGACAMCGAAVGAPQGQAEPVAWVRRHPSGELTGEMLPDAAIEPARRKSGAWLPLYLAAPAQPAQADEQDAMWPRLLEAVLREMPHGRDRGDGNAPGHSHSVPGIWDRDNGSRAGTECAWCLTWASAKSAIAAMTKEAT
jgi:hypothetical protein